MDDRRIIIRDTTRKVLVRDNGSVRIIEIARQGPPGAAAPVNQSLDGFVQDFSSPASSWTVNHNLGRNPLVAVLTTGNVEMEAQIAHTNNNQFVVYFAAPMAGRVRCI